MANEVVIGIMITAGSERVTKKALAFTSHGLRCGGEDVVKERKTFVDRETNADGEDAETDVSEVGKPGEIEKPCKKKPSARAAEAWQSEEKLPKARR